MGEPLIAKAANRQLLGFMNEAAFRAQWAIDEVGLGRTDFITLNRNLRRDLHNYSGRYATPMELIFAPFGLAATLDADRRTHHR